MNGRRFDLLVFDWDGTLYDSVDWIAACLRRAAEDCSLTPPAVERAKSVIGLALGDALTTLFPDAPAAVLPALMQHYQRHYGARDLTAEGLFQGVTDMLEVLRRRGYRLGIATGKTRRGLNRALTGTGLAPIFDATRCADETASKPDPEMLLQLMSALDVKPSRTLMVGDSIHDLQMARHAGVAAVGVTSGAHQGPQLDCWQPLACFDRVTDLLGILD